jgi:predicted AlkP superfamily pyrophosphatase or phosphodiesterase
VIGLKTVIMKRILACALAAASFLAAAPKKPKLVVAIVIDQFRYDYLTRFRSEYHSGLERLLTKGAVFTNARYIHFPTVTAVGHSTFLSGATPSLSGIIGNDWFDREEGKTVTSVSDSGTKLLGGSGSTAGSSPHRMLVDTLGDEMKMADEGKSKVIGISLKDRAAILPAGHMANGAYWFDGKTGNFVSSTYYFADLPAWVKTFNSDRPADRYHGATWLTKVMPAVGAPLYSAIDASPFANEMIERLAEAAIQAERLGQRDDATDLLAVSFSANDYVGHAVGPDSPEVHDMGPQTDRVLEKLFHALDLKVGVDNWIVVLTADHGVAPIPEVNAQRKMPGGRLPLGIVSKTVEAALEKRYGQGNWIVSNAEHSIYLNRELIAQKGLNSADVDRTAADSARTIPHVFRVYTREQLINGVFPDEVSQRVMNGYFERRGSDVEVLLDPYWIFTQTGATHGTTFGYDTHVPVIFMGPGIRPGRYDKSIAVNDIAPTLATMLDVETPSGSAGRVLSEMLIAQ